MTIVSLASFAEKSITPSSRTAPGQGGGRTQAGWKAGGVQAGWKAGGAQAGWKAGGAQAGWKAGRVQVGWEGGGSQAGWKAGGAQAGWEAGGVQAGWEGGGAQAGWEAGGVQAGWKAGGVQAGGSWIMTMTACQSLCSSVSQRQQGGHLDASESIVTFCIKALLLLVACVMWLIMYLLKYFIYRSRCEVPMRFTQGWHSGDAGVCLWAVHGATELRVFTVVAFCAAWNGGGVL